MKDIDQLRYPIGKFQMPATFSEQDLAQWMNEIKALPGQFSSKALSLSEQQLDTPYRPQGWTGRQVIHHVVDSHLNAYCRFKWVLTEDSPTIKPYFEDRWANLADTQQTPISISLDLLTALHHRWSVLLASLDRSDFDKYYFHPEYGNRRYTLGAVCNLYAWHGKHHSAHLDLL